MCVFWYSLERERLTVSTTVCNKNVTIVKCSLRDYDTIDSYGLLCVFLVVMVAMVVVVLLLFYILFPYSLTLDTMYSLHKLMHTHVYRYLEKLQMQQKNK